jgi:hypothetical protein
VKHTAAHNTVTLGGRSQAATSGKLLWLRSEKGYDACAIESDGAYPGSVLRRRLLLADQFLVDVFDVRTAKETQIDLLAHAISEKLAPVSALGAGAAAVPGKEDGYQHLVGGLVWQARGPTQWDFLAGKQKLRLWMDGPPRESLIACTGIGYTIDAKVPCLIRRVQGNTARFVTVYDLSGDASFVTGLRCEGRGDDSWVVRTRLGDRKVRLTEEGASLE